MTLQEELKAVKAKLGAENDLGGQRDVVKIAELEQQAAEIQAKINKIEEEEQAAAKQLRIQDATEQAAYFLDNLVIEGLTMRVLCVGEPQYQMLRIAVQNKIIQLAEENSRQISELQAEENAQQLNLKQQIENLQAKYDEESKLAREDHETIMQLRAQLSQSQAETVDYQSKLKNATDEIARLEGHVDDLRKDIAVGARNGFKVIDSEEQGKQMKALADEIKASRIKITDKKFTDYTNVTCEAILMQDLPSEGKVFGDRIEFPSVYVGKYLEVTAAEADQFRAERASNQEAVSDSALEHEETPNVTPEETFPELPSAIAPEAILPPEVQLVISAPTDGGESGQTVEERLSALEAHVFGYVKQAVA